MSTHDIIDNRSEKLVDHINRILSSTEQIGTSPILCIEKGRQTGKISLAERFKELGKINPSLSLRCMD